MFPSSGPARVGTRLLRAGAHGWPPLSLRRVRRPAGPGTSRRASELRAPLPGDPSPCPPRRPPLRQRGLLLLLPNFPSSSTQVPNLAGFGAGKPERGACAARCGVGWARSVGSSLQIAAFGCPAGPAAGFIHLQLGYVGPKAVLPSGRLRAFVMLIGAASPMLLLLSLLLFLTNCPILWGWGRRTVDWPMF